MLVFVGMGLNGLNDLTRSGIQWIQNGEKIYLDNYTSLIPNFSINELETFFNKKVFPVSRKCLEEDYYKILDEAKKEVVVLLIPGDPFVATTHMHLRLAAINAGIETKVIHSVSIQSAIYGETGLFNYKFGRTVTLTFPHGSVISETPYEVIKDNMSRGLHTLLLLEIDAERRLFMKIPDAIDLLRKLEYIKKENVITENILCVGCARIGSDYQKIRANYIYELLKEDFGDPPHSLIIVGKLHFIEAEALIKLANAPKEILR
ncbi:MAG: diphthine synthase [Candidatus Methanomethylicia archaeon]|nr:diphthine synthase [Candidatus Methanomethylicia archaeon]MCX8169100.1 diphthine synthase [Candidatus Methanomethylicia archaeon]MDW7988832.1 diphthine synthase [Nitrososphaerota archaeon]